MLRVLLFASVLLWVLPYWANAEPAGKDWKADAVDAMNVALGDDNGDGVRSVILTTDRAALLRVMPALQQHGAFPKDVTASELEKRPASTGNALALLLTSYAVRDLYAGRPDLAATRWKVLLSSAPDDAAHGTRETFSFAFDRPRYEDIDWDHLAFAGLPRATIGFRYNLRFTLEMSRELDGSIAND